VVAINLAGSGVTEADGPGGPGSGPDPESDSHPSSGVASGQGRSAGRLDIDAHGLTEVVARLRRALRASIRTDIAWEALPMAQVELMQSLAERSPARITDLADRLHLANSTVSGLVGQLMASNLIDRGTDPDDRRAAVVVLTGAGRATLVNWEAAHERRIGSALARLGVEQRRAIDLAVPALGELAGLLAEGSVSLSSFGAPEVSS
jgi:DNA-binding MarR family transcriptional regulator